MRRSRKVNISADTQLVSEYVLVQEVENDRALVDSQVSVPLITVSLPVTSTRQKRSFSDVVTHDKSRTPLVSKLTQIPIKQLNLFSKANRGWCVSTRSPDPRSSQFTRSVHNHVRQQHAITVLTFSF